MRGFGIGLLAGALFGLGLVVGGMTLPENVVGFLDFGGDWKPELMGVMGGAVAVYGGGIWLGRRREHTITGRALPTILARSFDRRTLFGGVLFGIGWGLSGLCPGPALVSLGTGTAEALLFVAAMIGGQLIVFQLTHRRRQAQATPVDVPTCG